MPTDAANVRIGEGVSDDRHGLTLLKKPAHKSGIFEDFPTVLPAERRHTNIGCAENLAALRSIGQGSATYFTSSLTRRKGQEQWIL